MEFAPGYRVSAVAHLLNLLDPRVERGLDLERHGLGFAAANLADHGAVGRPATTCVLEGAYGETIWRLARTPTAPPGTTCAQKLLRFAGVLRPFKDMTPPRLGRGAGNETAEAREPRPEDPRPRPRRPARVPAPAC